MLDLTKASAGDVATPHELDGVLTKIASTIQSCEDGDIGYERAFQRIMEIIGEVK